MIDVCSIQECASPRHARGYCAKHYGRWYRHGDASAAIPIVTTSDRFLSKVERDPITECWNWAAAMSDTGYGSFFDGAKTVGAHVFSYRLHVRDIPDGLEIDHLCRNHRCVNPTHLQPVTRRVNVERGFGPSALNMRKTHCIHGHEFTAENTYTTRAGHRQCATCRTARNRARSAA